MLLEGTSVCLGHCLARPSVALSRAVVPQCSSCHMCRGSIRGNDVEGCWGSLLVATWQGWARSSAQAAQRPAGVLQFSPGQSWATPRDQGRAGHSSTSSPFRGGAWRTHLDVFFPGWGSRNRASWLQWPAGWQLPWKAGDRGGGEVRAGPAVQAASALVTRFRALRQTLSRHFNEGFLVPLLQNRGKRKAGSCPRRRPGVLVSRCA